MENIVKSIKILGVSLIASCLLLGFVVIYLHSFKIIVAFASQELANTMLLVGNIIAALVIGIGLFIFNRKITEIVDMDVIIKLEKYREAFLIRAATMEGSCFLFLVIYIFTGNAFFLGESLVIIGLMIYYFPTDRRISNEIKEDVNSNHV